LNGKEIVEGSEVGSAGWKAGAEPEAEAGAETESEAGSDAELELEANADVEGVSVMIMGVTK
jgi:hypothetical protein